MGEKGDEGKPRAWERVSSEQLADYGIFRVRRDRARSPRDGSEHDFHVAESPDGVAVVALTEDRRLVLVEQFRHPFREVTLELPSGIVDEGESPAEAAARELREETGFEGGEAEVIGCIRLNPSWATSRVHVAVVRGAARTAEKDEDAGEETRVRLVPADRAREMVLKGEIDAGAAVCALALWMWNRERRGMEDG
jgi:ADP-ribose pyrophosphatase